MQEVKNKLNDLVRAMADVYAENDEVSDIGEIVKLQDIPPDLREALILLHSSYKSEFMAIKKHNFKTMYNLISTNAEAYDRILALMHEKEIALEEKLIAKKKFRVSFIRIFGFATIMIAIVITLWTLFAIDKEAGKLVIEFVKGITPIINGGGE